MSLWSRIKAAFSPVTYLQASTRQLDGYGTLGSKPRPFNYDLAVRQFYDWCYAAAILNAGAVANVGKQLFVRRRAGRKLYETRPVSKRIKKIFAGESDPVLRPSMAVMRKYAQFGGDVEEVIEPHPALDVLSRVNPWMNGTELTELRMVSLQLTGNTYLHVTTDRIGTPEQIWWMPSQWTKIIPCKENFIKGYGYGITEAEMKAFAPDDVIHFKLPNPRDLHYGMGWAEAAWSSLGLHKSKRILDTAKFDNMARPDWLLIVKSGAGQKELDRFKAKVNEELRGADKGGKFLTMSGDISAQNLQLDIPEIGTATRVIEEISAVSGVPVSMLLSNDPNRSGSEVARLSWYRNTIRRYCRIDEEKLNEKWVPRFDGSDDYFLAYDPVSFEDVQAVTKNVTALVSGGIISPNEARSELGYAEADGADYLYPPAGNTGASASAMGDLSPEQNDERQGGRGEKRVAMMPPKQTTAEPSQPGESEGDALRSEIESYGIAVRAGVVTPQAEDENVFRGKLGLPPASADAQRAWADDKGVRRPITLTPAGGEPKPAPMIPTAGNAEEDQANEDQ